METDGIEMPINFPTGGVRLAKLVCALVERVEQLEADMARLEEPTVRAHKESARNTIGLTKV